MQEAHLQSIANYIVINRTILVRSTCAINRQLYIMINLQFLQEAHLQSIVSYIINNWQQIGSIREGQHRTV